VLVFDPLAWDKAGGDVGNNAIFWKQARIVRLRGTGRDRVADIEWIDTGTRSCGHFVSEIRKLTYNGGNMTTDDIITVIEHRWPNLRQELQEDYITGSRNFRRALVDFILAAADK
jgi:hypothetical protein